MNLTPVQSSQIAAIGHDAAANHLFVQFRRGDTYRYENVTVDAHAELMRSESVGKHFNAHLRHLPATKLAASTATIGSVVPAQERPTSTDAVAAAPKSGKPQVVVSGSVETIKVVEAESQDLATRATQVQVTDLASQEQASTLLLSIANLRSKVKQTWEPMKKAAHEAHRVICQQEKTVDEPLARAEAILKTQIAGFIRQQQEAARAEEERRRREERQRAEDEARREAERLAIEDAVTLEAEGKQEEAEAVLNNPVPVPARYVAPAPVAAQVAQVAGVTAKSVIKFRVIDTALIPRQYLTVDETKIRKVVAALGHEANIPGVETYDDTQIAASRRTA